MSRWLKYLILILLFLLAGSIPLAMVQTAAGSIEGFITDEYGVVEQASVEANEILTGAVSQTASDANGYYKIGGIRAGRYSLWVQAPAHDSIWIANVNVERGQTTRENVVLKRFVFPTSE